LAVFGSVAALHAYAKIRFKYRSVQMNAVEIELAISALAEQSFTAQEFPYAFLEAFGNKSTTIKRLRSGASNKSDLGGVLQTSNIHIAVAAPGEVSKALAALKASPATAKAKAKFILATDGEMFEAEDLETEETVACPYPDFPNHFGFFLPLAGITTVRQIRGPLGSRRSTVASPRSAQRMHGKRKWRKVPPPSSGSRMKDAMSDIDLDDLRAELAEFAQPEKNGGHSAREERIIAGFEEIQRFVDKHNRAPQHGEDRDIFERLYAVRLDRLRTLEECRSLLTPLDHQGLLAGLPIASSPSAQTIDEDELRAELEGAAGAADITALRHVRPSEDKRAAEEIANRTKCEDFERFKPLFEKVQREMANGERQTRPFELKSEIRPGSWFIVGGQKAYVADMGEIFTNAQGRTDARLRVIFDNGTESNMLMRSLQRALHKDEAGRRITDPVAGPLFADKNADGDLASGTIYVLRSKSDHPVVAASRDVLHKIGVTGGDVPRRLMNAKLDPTFLMADVEVIATYELFNISRVKLENLIHRIFDPARLDIEIKDRFGHPVVPREWFLVPLFVINEAVDRIKDGTITGYIYDPKSARLVIRGQD
jgi:hypothetical protein